MEPDGAGTVVRIVGELKVSVPLVGGKVEQWAGAESLDALKKEQEFTASWLARH
jgi:hypothetical protein